MIKINSQIKKPHLKMIPIKDKLNSVSNFLHDFTLSICLTQKANFSKLKIYRGNIPILHTIPIDIFCLHLIFSVRISLNDVINPYKIYIIKKKN